MFSANASRPAWVRLSAIVLVACAFAGCKKDQTDAPAAGTEQAAPATEAAEQPAVASEIKEAVDTLRARRVEDHIRASQQELGRVPQEYQNLRERIIAQGIRQFNRTMEEALRAARSAQNDNTERQNADALDQTRDLVRGLESIDERLRQQTAALIEIWQSDAPESDGERRSLAHVWVPGSEL